MAGNSSADLLAMFNRLAGRPDSDAITDPEKYQWLADAQQTVVSEIAAIAPHVLIGAPIAMTTADGGQTWTFGTDVNGNAILPLGKTGVYPSLVSIPDDPWAQEFDYLNEGTRIRLPGNASYPGPLYWQGITPPVDLTATVQPVLNPPAARELIAIKAVKDFAESAEQNQALAAAMAARWAHAFPRWMLALRTQFRSGGALAPLVASTTLSGA